MCTEYLRELVGKDIIRIGPVIEDGEAIYSICDFSVRLIKINEDGTLKVKYEFVKGRGVYRTVDLPIWYSDDQWRSSEILKNGEPTELDDLIGKEVKRLSPVVWNPIQSDYSFIKDPVVLIFATEHHVIVKAKGPSGLEFILDRRYADPNDWVGAA